MPRRIANCPACAAPVEFLCRTSLVAVCGNCQTVVARGDKRLEDHGKVADLAVTQSPLKIGVRGKFRGKPFYISGRVQFSHSAGGVWDEWFCLFPNGKWGWLAEAQGRFYLTFEELERASELPEPDSLSAGESIDVGFGKFTVAEVGVGRVGGAEGEIPFALTPNAEHRFADLYAEGDQFATLDYSEATPKAYVGWQVTLDNLGLAKLAPNEKTSLQVKALKVSCPQCAGSLELRAPDTTQRVACPYCGSLLDCNQGNLSYLSTLKLKVKPLIELGAEGELFGAKFTIIGFMQRSVTFDKKYFWTEYLLYEPKVGFRWLVHSDNHWSFAEPVSTADVADSHATAAYKGQTFRLFQEAVARVESVIGEFYWKVEVGEHVLCRDYVRPPLALSIERSQTGQKRQSKARKDEDSAVAGISEINISLAHYVPHAEIEAAFGVKNLPRGWGVAPNQPQPCDRAIYLNCALFVLAFVVIYFFAQAIGLNPDGWLLIWAMGFIALLPIAALFINQNFEQRRWADSEFGES